jgi:hypothetical protein
MPPMWSLYRPDDRQLQPFLEAQAAQSFSYVEIGLYFPSPPNRRSREAKSRMAA